MSEIRGIVESQLRIWGKDSGVPLEHISTLVSCVAGDIAKAARSGDKSEMSNELGNLALACLRFIDVLGFDVEGQLAESRERHQSWADRENAMEDRKRLWRPEHYIQGNVVFTHDRILIRHCRPSNVEAILDYMNDHSSGLVVGSAEMIGELLDGIVKETRQPVQWRVVIRDGWGVAAHPGVNVWAE